MHPEHGITNYGEIINDLENDRDAWQTEAFANLARAERAEAEAQTAILAASDATRRAEDAEHALAHCRAQLGAEQGREIVMLTQGDTGEPGYWINAIVSAPKGADWAEIKVAVQQELNHRHDDYPDRREASNAAMAMLAEYGINVINWRTVEYDVIETYSPDWLTITGWQFTDAAAPDDEEAQS